MLDMLKHNIKKITEEMPMDAPNDSIYYMRPVFKEEGRTFEECLAIYELKNQKLKEVPIDLIDDLR
jgi:hypothetical protein